MIVTNDMIKTMDQVVCFYNQRGKIEREFDVPKNDFGWNHLLFSKLEQNMIYLIFTAICRNLYPYIITLFSKTNAHLNPTFRIKNLSFGSFVYPLSGLTSQNNKASYVWSFSF